MAEAGGFKGIDGERVAQLVYLRLPGGRVAGEERILNLDPSKTAADALKQLTGLIRKFDDPKTPYLSSRRPMFLDRPGDYDHLARVLEWRGKTGDGS